MLCGAEHGDYSGLAFMAVYWGQSWTISTGVTCWEDLRHPDSPTRDYETEWTRRTVSSARRCRNWVGRPQVRRLAVQTAAPSLPGAAGDRRGNLAGSGHRRR